MLGNGIMQQQIRATQYCIPDDRLFDYDEGNNNSSKDDMCNSNVNASAMVPSTNATVKTAAKQLTNHWVNC